DWIHSRRGRLLARRAKTRHPSTRTVSPGRPGPERDGVAVVDSEKRPHVAGHVGETISPGEI
ncbi:MAG: hypothetical protein M3N68_04700, partial [Actinomycetota bacterium]|nr:hypothetical protein [Actinomycetota bacterium]